MITPHLTLVTATDTMVRLDSDIRDTTPPTQVSRVIARCDSVSVLS